MSLEENSNKLAVVMARAVEDETFRKALLADSNAVLKAEGLELPAGCAINFVENTPTQIHIVLPPRSGELSDAQLDFAGGFSLSDLKEGAIKFAKEMLDARIFNDKHHVKPHVW